MTIKLYFRLIKLATKSANLVSLIKLGCATTKDKCAYPLKCCRARF
jgi:hypothetical protein